ncbi:hypothetical protein VPH35_043044 [Triticum aestivum]
MLKPLYFDLHSYIWTKHEGVCSFRFSGPNSYSNRDKAEINLQNRLACKPVSRCIVRSTYWEVAPLICCNLKWSTENSYWEFFFIYKATESFLREAANVCMIMT